MFQFIITPILSLIEKYQHVFYGEINKFDKNNNESTKIVNYKFDNNNNESSECVTTKKMNYKLLFGIFLVFGMIITGYSLVNSMVFQHGSTLNSKLIDLWHTPLFLITKHP